MERPRQPVEVAERLGVLRVGEEIGRSEGVAVRIGRAQQRLMAAHLAVGRAHDRLERAREAALRRVRDRDAIARLAESRRRKVIVAQPVKHGLEHRRNSSCVSLPFDTHVVRGHIDYGLGVFHKAAFDRIGAQSPAPALSGLVASAEEGAMEGVLVSAQQTGSPITITVVTGADETFSFPAAKNTTYLLSGDQKGLMASSVPGRG